MNRVMLALGLLLCALAAADTFVATAHPAPESAPPKPQAVDCAQMKALGLDMQANPFAFDMRRLCGHAEGSGLPIQRLSPSIARKTTHPDAYGGPDVDVITSPQPFWYRAQF